MTQKDVSELLDLLSDIDDRDYDEQNTHDNISLKSFLPLLNDLKDWFREFAGVHINVNYEPFEYRYNCELTRTDIQPFSVHVRGENNEKVYDFEKYEKALLEGLKYAYDDVFETRLVS
jgi:hypothetical protein